MNLNQLEYFVAAAENLNFTKAANQCFISQTAMTQQIKALEKSIGVPLFIRDKHHVELTTAGKVYLREVRAILERSDEAIRMARIATAGTEGSINVGFISGFGASDCPDILRNFHNAYPNIQMDIYRDTLSGLVEALKKGECDVAFTLELSKDQARNVEHKYIRSYPLMAVLDAGHHLSNKTTLNYSDLINEKFILMQPSARAKDEMEESILLYERGGFVPDVVAFEREPETILLMISLGMGIALMPEYIVRHHHKNPDLKILPIEKDDGTAETLSFEIAWSKNNSNPAVDRLLAWLEDN
ncbi:MAG: LysR family transcriptional regulator [Saccharofermentans sp.]|nr:LysR family transcriptional regulator [Saccharofermentans sp.]